VGQKGGGRDINKGVGNYATYFLGRRSYYSWYYSWLWYEKFPILVILYSGMTKYVWHYLLFGLTSYYLWYYFVFDILSESVTKLYYSFKHE